MLKSDMEPGNEHNKNMEERLQISIKPITGFDRLKYQELLDEIMRVEEEAWPEEWRATRDKFASRLEIFPQGFFIAFQNGKMAGVSTSEVVNYSPEEMPSSWDVITDDGYIRLTHRLSGDALYVVSVGVSKDFQGQGIGRSLVEAQKELAKKLNLDYLFLGARMPMYSAYHHSHPEISAEKYVKLEESPGRKLDPEIRFYESCGLRIEKVVPNYGPDLESENYGVIMVWKNNNLKSQ